MDFMREPFYLKHIVELRAYINHLLNEEKSRLKASIAKFTHDTMAKLVNHHDESLNFLMLM